MFTPTIVPNPQAVGNAPYYLKWQELDQRQDAPADDFSLENQNLEFTRGYGTTPILIQTPWIFHIAPPWQLSYLDRLIDNGILALSRQREAHAQVGTWAPFFYNDRQPTFIALPRTKVSPITPMSSEKPGSGLRISRVCFGRGRTR